MEIVVPPPQQVVTFLLALPLLTVVVALLLRGKPLVHRVAPVVIVSAACALFYHFALRPMRFSWDRDGIRDATFGEERRIGWSDVRDVRLVRSFRGSEYRPVLRTDGTFYAGFSSGTWRLANGGSVRVFLEPTSVDALLVTTADSTYLYSPRSFEPFVDAVRAGTRRLPSP